MPYYRVRVNRYTTNIQSYYVNVNTDCPEHAKEMASEVLEAHLEGEDHELAGFKPEAFGEKEEVAEDAVLKDARLTLTDGIMGLSWNMTDAGDEMAKMLNEFHKEFTDSEFFRFGDSFRILTEDSDRVRRHFQSLPRENQYSSGLAKIKVSVPEGHSRSDVMAFVTEILHYNGIDMADALFTQDGLVIVLKEEDAPRAYEKLRAQISR